MYMKRLIIVIPIYNRQPSKIEEASLEQIAKVMDWDKYDMRLICPDKFTDSDIMTYARLLHVPYDVYMQHMRYDDDYFSSQKAYSRLMKNNDLYKSFRGYEYMLLVQTDAWILSLDNIEKWMDRGFDYVGAPIISNVAHWPSAPVCGNGGLSLRRISKFIYMTSLKHICQEVDKNEVCHDYEDVFYCEGMTRHLYIDMPIWQDAASFAWDMNPDILYAMLDGCLPEVGIHAWAKNIPFWEQHISIPDYARDAAYDIHKDFIKCYY